MATTFSLYRDLRNDSGEAYTASYPPTYMMFEKTQPLLAVGSLVYPFVFTLAVIVGTVALMRFFVLNRAFNHAASLPDSIERRIKIDYINVCRNRLNYTLSICAKLLIPVIGGTLYWMTSSLKEVNARDKNLCSDLCHSIDRGLSDTADNYMTTGPHPLQAVWLQS